MTAPEVPLREAEKAAAPRPTPGPPVVLGSRNVGAAAVTHISPRPIRRRK